MADEDYQEPQQIPVQQQPMYPQFTQGLHPATVKIQLFYEDIMDDIEHTMKGEALEMTPEGEKWVQKLDPILPPEAFNNFITALRVHAHRGFLLTQWSDKQVNIIAEGFERMIVNMLFMKGKDWGIAIYQYELIRISIADNLFAILNRAYQNKERELIAGTQRKITTESYNVGEMREPKGRLFGLLK